MNYTDKNLKRELRDDLYQCYIESLSNKEVANTINSSRFWRPAFKWLFGLVVKKQLKWLNRYDGILRLYNHKDTAYSFGIECTAGGEHLKESKMYKLITKTVKF